MKAVVIQHEENEGLFRLEGPLRAAGFTAVSRFRAVKHEDLNADLVIVMGGSMGVYESDRHPFLNEELGLLQQRLAMEKPVLGICLGAQLLAAAAGAEVTPGKNGFEVGALPVRWTQQGLADPVIAGVKPKTVVAHWHGDTWSAVPGATLLASTDRYTQQAFRLGASYGFQFHPELNAADLGAWLDGGRDDLVVRGKNVEELKAQLPRLRGAEAEVDALRDRLMDHFAQVCRQQ